MDSELTYMDCWYFISSRIPVNTDYGRTVYCMCYQAMKEAEKKRLTEKRKKRREQDGEK